MRLMRKYTSNRGSALFMVISVMTALMMSCMAMYFSVVSSRSTQYAIFNQQQSKQVAESINDAVVAGMMDGQLEVLTNAMTQLGEGEKLKTGANGFAAFGVEGGVENDRDLGAYSMEITRLPNEVIGGVEKMVFDIVVTSSVNGANEVYHTIIYYEGSKKDDPPAPTQVFAATGYVPNDVFLDGGRFITDVFFDNEMTIVNAYGGKNMELWGNLSTGGSLTVHGYLIPSKEKSAVFAIRDTYTANFNQPVGFSSTADKSLVLIGGDCICNENNGFSNANVYIQGDLIIRGNPDLGTSNYFVDGNVIVEARKTDWGMAGFWVNLENVYCNGIVDASRDTGGGINGGLAGGLTNGIGKTAKTWNQMAESGDYYGVLEMGDELEARTATNVYYKWVINDSNPGKDKYVKELDESRPGTVVKRTIHFDLSDTNPIPTVELRYSSSEQGCIIEDVTCNRANTSFNDMTLIIDTGEDEDNIYTIRVKPNRDYDGDNVNETFTWYPFEKADSSVRLHVLVKGRGSVVIDIPKGVTYQDMSFQQIMHYGWYVLGGGVENDNHGHIYTINNTSDVLLDQFIHSECKSGDGCSYTEKKSTNKCSSCESEMKYAECSVHGALTEFCPNCQPAKVGNHEGECVNHVGRKEIDAYLTSRPALKERMMGSDGKLIYPTANIFLVSCDESANIRLSVMEDGSSVIQNSFFGYIYAPYMTFKAYRANQGGGMVRLLGGMTVSDYIIDDSMSMIACWPEKMPTDLMSDECKQNKLDGIANRGWKISVKTH